MFSFTSWVLQITLRFLNCFQIHGGDRNVGNPTLRLTNDKSEFVKEPCTQPYEVLHGSLNVLEGHLVYIILNKVSHGKE